MSIEVFKAKSGAKLAELIEQSRASVAGESRGLCQENRSASQEGMSEASATRKLSVKLNHVINLPDYAVMSNVSSNACMS